MHIAAICEFGAVCTNTNCLTIVDVYCTCVDRDGVQTNASLLCPNLKY